MQAIILAAGRGSRLASVMNGKPKCLAPVGGRHLIEHQLSVLCDFGINDVCVVVGYRADEVCSIVGDSCHYIVNDRYAETNSLYSLWLTRNWVKGSLLVINGDVLAHPRVYRHVLVAPGNVLAYDSLSGTEEDHMKVSFDERGRLRRISKALCVEETHGENVGLLKFEASSTASLFREAEAVLSQGGQNEWAPAAVDRLARKRQITGVDVSGLPWVEIDFPEDWQYACEKVWPMISRAFVSSRPRKTMDSLVALQGPEVCSEVLS